MNIKQLLKSAAYWTVPTGVYELILTQFQGLRKKGTQLSREDKALLDKNILLKDRHKGQKCFILCTGPSINKQNLLPLRDEITFSVSKFYFHKDYSIIKPKYHCVPGIVRSLFTEKDIVRWFTEMDKRIGDAEIFLSIAEKHVVEKNGLFQSRKINYLNMAGGLEIHEANIDLTGKMPGVQSVPIMCIMIALYMGFKEIYLLGTEHDSYKTGKYEYFFKEPLCMGQDPSVNKNGERIDSVFDTLSTSLNLRKQYRDLKRISNAKGISIYNVTEGGALDEFERMSLESLFVK